MKKLNQKNLDVYLFIKEYIEKNKYCPSYREIMDNTNYNSPATIKEVVEKLNEFGFIKVSRNTDGNIITRSIRIVDNDKVKKQIEEIRNEYE